MPSHGYFLHTGRNSRHGRSCWRELLAAARHHAICLRLTRAQRLTGIMWSCRVGRSSACGIRWRDMVQASYHDSGVHTNNVMKLTSYNTSRCALPQLNQILYNIMFSPCARYRFHMDELFDYFGHHLIVDDRMIICKYRHYLIKVKYSPS
jgi:hypothetical protein